MKKIWYVMLGLLISVQSPAQVPVIQWAKCFGGSGGDVTYSIRQTFDSGYIIAGSTTSNDGQVSGNHGSYDYWVVKTDDTGGIQWQKCYGGNVDEIAYSVQQTLDSGYVIAGGAESSDTDDVMCPIMEWKYWIVKTSPTGTIQWTKCLGGSNYNMASSIRQTHDSGYIICGKTNSLDGDVTGYHGTVSGAMDYWVVKLSSTGVLQWEKAFGGSLTDDAKCIRPTSDGGYIVAGESNSIDGDVTGNHGGQDFWVVKLDDTGAIQWEKSLGGTSNDIAWAVEQTIDGGYVVAGTSNSTDGDVTGHHGPSTTSDIWLAKLSSAGAIQWQNSFGGIGNEQGLSLDLTADRGFIIGGISDSNSLEVNGNHGSDDYWVIKVDEFGNLVWQKSMGGTNIDDAHSIQLTADGGIVVAGFTQSTDVQVTGNHGGQDFWVVKMHDSTLNINNNNPASNTVKIVPNPSSGIYTLQGIEHAHVKILDCIGQKVLEAEDCNKFSLKSFDNGIYIAYIYDENGLLLSIVKLAKQ